MTRVVVAQEREDSEMPYIVAAGQMPSVGVRRGVLVESDDAAQVVTEVLRHVSMQCGQEPDMALVAIGGSSMTMRKSKGVVVVGRADGVVDHDDIERVLAAAQAISLPSNKEILHVLPHDYKLDEQGGVSDPMGMKCVRLEADTTIIDVPTQDMRNIEQVLELSGASVDEVVAVPLAIAQSALDRQQKELGVVVIDIGAATTSICVYEENELVHMAVLPIGAGHITNDLAIGLRTSVSVAEQVKLQYGTAVAATVDRREECDLSVIDPQEDLVITRHHIAEIIQARMEEIFAMVQEELQKIGKADLLPAGAVLTGGGAKLPHIVPLAKEILHLPVHLGEPNRLPGIFDSVDDPAFVTALGLIHWRINHESSHESTGAIAQSASKITSAFANPTKKLKGLFDKFMP